MPSYDFDGKVAFVTGGARGQGRSHALRYAENGADVVVADIARPETTAPYEFSTRERLDETVGEIEDRGQSALAVELDVREEAQVQAGVETAIDEFGRIDLLANNAGLNSLGGLLELEEAKWDEMIDTNLKGMWLSSKHVGRHMVERGGGGKIVNTASNFAFTGIPQMGHYAASKHGVLGLTKTLALELAEHDVNVNAVAPTAVNTALIQGVLGEAGEELMMEVDQLTGPSNLFDPEDPLIEPEDVSAAVMWLSSEAARFVTGTCIKIDAGATAK